MPPSDLQHPGHKSLDSSPVAEEVYSEELAEIVIGGVHDAVGGCDPRVFDEDGGAAEGGDGGVGSSEGSGGGEVGGVVGD
jgi:hypothetical protein